MLLNARALPVLSFAVMLSINAAELHAADPVLKSYEPTTMGYTWDSDDVPFFDFKISVKYPLFPELTGERVFFAFSGRFGQYIGTRSSSPVIGKRFNPKLFLKLPFDAANRDRGYVDIAYAHESNGQQIDSLEEFNAAQNGESKPEFAKDYISRGWDYLEVVVKNTYAHDEQNKLSTFLTVNYYLPNGLLQGKPEEYNAWENDREGKRRATVNGLRAMLKYGHNDDENKKRPVTDFKAALILETGYLDAFQNWTVRGELATKLWELPIMLWASSGYNSDLALYYKRVTSYGVTVEIGSF
ncbi:MAG: phospholipase A [Gammaproteobacteria bacterium]|nr:phospholipase A [Gammaproteobacteria bacterium]